MNIPGVELLYTSKYVIGTTWGWHPLNFLLVAIIIIAIVTIFIGINNRDAGNIIAGSFSLVCCIVLMLAFSSAAKNVYGTEYCVTINDDVAFAEIADNYQVKDVNGRLYTLRPYNIVPWEGD